MFGFVYYCGTDKYTVGYEDSCGPEVVIKSDNSYHLSFTLHGKSQLPCAWHADRMSDDRYPGVDDSLPGPLPVDSQKHFWDTLEAAFI